MSYQLWIADEARKVGLKVVEQPGWKTRGSSTFAPQALLAHHTASDSDSGSVSVVTNGRSDLPGPLSQFVLGKDGTVYIIAAGKANHAGEGVWKGLSGNTSFFGIEAVNKGDGTPWPQVQLDAYYRLAAVILKYLGKTADYVAGHKEYATPPGRKIDPKGIDMANFRARVAALLNPIPAEEIPMAYTFYRPQQAGYVVLQSKDGGIFTYDGAPFLGSLPSIGVVSKAVGLAWTPSGNGYWILGEDGAVFTFGDAVYRGGWNAFDSTVKGNRKPIGIVAKGDGYIIVTFDPSNDGTPYDSYGFNV